MNVWVSRKISSRFSFYDASLGPGPATPLLGRCEDQKGVEEKVCGSYEKREAQQKKEKERRGEEEEEQEEYKSEE